VVGARQAQPSERGEEGMMRGMHCGGGGRGVAPFYRVGERRWSAGEVGFTSTSFEGVKRRGRGFDGELA
jgi:hypothetical protein